MNKQQEEKENASTGAAEQKTKKRKIVIYPDQLFEINEAPKDLIEEAKQLMEAMPGIGWDYAYGIAKYNQGKADHPIIAAKK